MTKRYTDHLGNEYNTKKEMAKTYGLEWETLKSRLRAGKTLEEALTTPVDEKLSHPGIYKKPEVCTDHLGNVYKNKSEMAKAYGIDQRTVKHRLDAGWSLEDALTKAPSLSGSDKKGDDGFYDDGHGNKFNTIKEMAIFHNLTESQLRHRIAKGMSFYDAVEGSKKMIDGSWQTEEWEDHLGNKYSSAKERAEAYGLENSVVRTRLRRGWNLEKALTTKADGKTDSVQVTDSHGNIFGSIREMADAYGMKYHTLQGRLKKGWSVEDALTIPPKDTAAQKWYDHLGNEYDNQKLLCEAYGINDATFRRRLKMGWSMENVLTTPVQNTEVETRGCEQISGQVDKKYIDHLGNEYLSQKDMCNAYDIDPSTFRDRLKRGWSLEKALTSPITQIRLKEDGISRPVKDLTCNDHLGNTYSSFSEMCRAYGKASRTVRDRLKKGCDLQTALTAQYAVSGETSTDHLGNTYLSFADMCRAYGKNPTTVKGRLKRGCDLERALTLEYYMSDTGYERDKSECTDHLGNIYDNVADMCRHYGISANTYKARIRRGMDVKTALTSRNKVAVDKNVTDHLGNAYENYDEMAKVYGLAAQTIKNRLYSGMTLEQALTTPPKNPGNTRTPGKYVINGKEYDNAGDIEREFGIKRSTFSRRLQQGMTPEEAVQSDVIFHKPRNTKIIDHKGREFRNLYDACQFYKIPYGTVFARLKAGWTQEEALRIPGNIGRSIPTNKDPLFELEGQQYYHFECPLCKNVFVFTKADMKRHFLTHAEENEINE
jgi:hypothetical protein